MDVSALFPLSFLPFSFLGHIHSQFLCGLVMGFLRCLEPRCEDLEDVRLCWTRLSSSGRGWSGPSIAVAEVLRCLELDARLWRTSVPPVKL